MGLSGKRQTRVGILSSFERNSDELRYVAQLIKGFPQTDVQFTVLADESGTQPGTTFEGAQVVRCWQRHASRFDALGVAVQSCNIDILHVVAPMSSFDAAQLAALFVAIRGEGKRIIIDSGSPFSLISAERIALNGTDRVIVGTSQHALELIACGVSADLVQPLGPRGGAVVPELSPYEARKMLSIGESERVVLLFGVDATDTELRDICRTVSALRLDGPVRLILSPMAGAGTGGASAPTNASKRVSALVSEWSTVKVLPELTWDDLPKYLAVSSVVAFAGSSASEAAATTLLAAVASKLPIVAPQIEPYLGFDGRVLYSSSRLSIAEAMTSILSNAEFLAHAAEFAEKNALHGESASRADRFSALASLYVTLRGTPATEVPSATGYEVPQGRVSAPPVGPQPTVRAPRILMQNRENAYTQPGGDTVVMDRISEGLRARGITVDIDLKSERNPRDYDLVHLFNFALKEHTEKLAKRCQQLSVPYVVTTMYEDWPLFFNQMGAYTSALEAYVNAGQPADRWAELMGAARAVRPSPIWDNSLTANFSSALIATGSNEAAALRRDYPAAKRIETYFCGSDCSEQGDRGELFRTQTGIQDFVLCVGRFEFRKNQLMLLKALEDSELTVVFASGGFSYQPQYRQLCERFKRRGKTVFLDRLDGKMLVSAFQAARVHVLPSWCELPGIVSLEAARLGTNVVVTDYGTARDYFQELAWYCRPDEPETIANAVTAAFYAHPKQGLRERVSRYTWDTAALRNGEIYRSVLAERGEFDWSSLGETRVQPPTVTQRVSASVESVRTGATEATRTVERIPQAVVAPFVRPMEPSEQSDEAVKLCEEGDQLMRKGDREASREKYRRAEQIAPTAARPARSLAVLALDELRYDEAEKLFRLALQRDGEDGKSQLGLGLVRWGQGKKDEAFEIYLACARRNPRDGTALLQLVGSAYELNRLGELELALRAFLKTDPDNTNILYCLAGCCYRRGRSSMALGVIERILSLVPEHVAAMELKTKIDSELMTTEQPRSANTGAMPGSPLGATNGTPRSRPVVPTARLDELEGMKKARRHEELFRACEDYLKEVTLSPADRVHGMLLKAEALACLNQLDAADRLFAECESESAMGHSPLGYRALAGRGVVCAAHERWSDARAYFQRAIEMNMNADVALAGLGLCETATGTKEKAWDFFQRALGVNPENLRALLGVVELGYVLKRLPETAHALETYLEFRPIDIAINYAYAGCCYVMGQKQKAQQELQKILLLDSSHQLAAELLKKIQSDERTAVNAR